MRSSWLTPLPFRGDLIAAGAVVLAVGVLLLEARMVGVWPAGPRLAVAAATAALVLALAWRAPVEGPTPRIYVSALLVVAFPLVATSFAVLADVLGAEDVGGGSVTWVAAVLAVGYAAVARLRNSAICTLLAALSAVVAAVAALDWIAEPADEGAYRWVLLGCVVALALGTLRLRDRHRRHAVSLVDVAGLAAAAIGALSAAGSLFGETETRGVAWGWELLLAGSGFALIAYAGADRERGPGYVGALVLALFVVAAGSDRSLLWWPLLLVALGAGVVVAGLRPTTPLPPSPDADAPLTVPSPMERRP